MSVALDTATSSLPALPTQRTRQAQSALPVEHLAVDIESDIDLEIAQDVVILSRAGREHQHATIAGMAACLHTKMLLHGKMLRNGVISQP